MTKSKDKWKKRFEKFTNKGGFSNFKRTDWKIRTTAKELEPYIQKELDKAREEERKLIKSAQDTINQLWGEAYKEKVKQTLLKKIEEMKEKFQSKTTDYSEGYGNGWASAINKIKKIIKETI